MKLLCVFIVLGLTACTFPNRSGPEMFTEVAPVEGTGLILLSTSAPRACMSTATYLKVMPADQTYYETEVAALNVNPRVDVSNVSKRLMEFSGYAVGRE